MLIDSDVLIWYLRGNENAQKVIYANIPFKISIITYVEILHGMRNKKEMFVFQKQLREWSVDIIQINEEVSTRAMFFVEDYFLSHSMEFADAIIAATAMEYQENLLTANDKHYKFIPNLTIKKFKPT